MTDKKITQLTSITGADVDDAADVFVLADVSAGENKKITRAELFQGVEIPNALHSAASFAADTLASNGDVVLIDGVAHICASSANTPQHTNASSVKAFDLSVRQKETFDHYSTALSNGEQTPAIEGLVYVKDSALTGTLHSLTASCTKDLAVDGFRAFEVITPNHCGYTASSSASDAASEVKSAFYLLAGNSEIKTLDLLGQSISITQLTGLPDLTAKTVRNGTLTSSANAHTVVDLPDLAGVVFDGVKFETTAVAATDQVYGVVNSNDQAITDTVFHRCEFSAPSAFTNGFKAINEATNTINGLVFDSCKVDDVGRLGIEFQNHNADTVKRMDNLIVRDCIIDGTGLSGATYGMGISFSGYLGACQAIGNTIRDCGAMDIEFAGGETIAMLDNIHENPVRPFGISGSSYTKKEAVIEGNSCVGYATTITYLRDVEKVRMAGNSYRLDKHLEVYDVEYFSDESVWRTKGNYAIYMGLSVDEARFAGYYDTVDSTTNFATLRLDGTSIGQAVLSGVINHGASGSAYDSINSAPSLIRTQGSIVDGVVAYTASETFHGGITKDFFSTDNTSATITFTNTATSWQPISLEVAVHINQSSGADMGQGVILIPTRIISTPGLNRGTTQDIVTSSGVTLSVTSTTTSVTVTATAPASWSHGIAAFAFKASGRFVTAEIS